MYTLTLTRDERQAIEWVGNRYWNGDDFKRLLWNAKNDLSDWESDKDITFFFEEFEAWQIKDHYEQDGLPCFSVEFELKIVDFIDDII
jgi:hypothetical protein